MGLVSGKRGSPHYCLLVLLLLAAPCSTAQPRIDSMAVIDVFGRRKLCYPDSAAQLPAQENYLTFFCSGHENSPVQYRLLGLADTWTTGQSTDQIHYANLSGGQYRFQLRPLANATEQPLAEWVINIDTPFWKRIWFWPMILLYLMGVMGIIIYLFVRYRFLQKLRATKVRDRIARDLHDDLGSYLSSISIMSRSAANAAAKNPERARAQLDTIGQTARHMLESMGDIVWSINPAHDSIAHVTDRMTDVANSLFTDTDVSFELQVGPDVAKAKLSAEARRDFFLIYKEAVTNVARYAQATRVRVSLQRIHTDLMMTVQDNGCGFDPTHPAHKNPGGGNGLRNMQARANLIGGELSVQSTPGEGTTVRLVVAGGAMV